MEFLRELNEAQRAAAMHVDGPMMVIAGAGSGKTRVLTYRIAHLIELGVDPFEVLALTFTNKASREMKERIGKVVGDERARNIWMGTFHSVFARILRIESDRINYPRNFTIYDTADSRSVLKEIIKGMGLDDKVYKPSSIQNRISAAKNNLIDAAGYADHPEISGEDAQAGRPMLATIYQAYEKKCFRAQAMDFDDLLFKMNILLREFPDLLSKYQHKFRYLLVDEYQDTNFAQYLIIKQLAALNENICVVGDDAQSIYGFRGANIQNILNFKEDYPDFSLYKLEQNYRSTKTIVQAANSVIALNKDQIQKDVWTHNLKGNPLEVHQLYSDNEEGKFVSSRIFEVHSAEQQHWRDFAILYRTNAQSRAFEEGLRKLNIPYRIFGGLSFYQRKEIKDLIAYFRLTANPSDDEAFKRVLNYPARGIGKTTVDKITVEAAERDCSFWDAISNPLAPPTSLKGAAWKKVQDFVTMMQGFTAQLDRMDASALGMHIARHTGLVHALHQDKTPEGVARYDNVQELLGGVQAFVEQQQTENPDALPTLGDFLMDVALLTDADVDDGDDNKVSLMTIHAAKGLEFPHVHLVGMEENLFPSQMAMQSRAELEEERRLFYVALTRAEQSCTLSYALTRFKWGQVIQSEISRFIDEIDESCLSFPTRRAPQPTPFSGGASLASERQRWNAMPNAGSTNASDAFARLTSKAQPQNPTPSPFKGAGNRLKRVDNSAPPQPVEQVEFSEGTKVSHDKFGKGTVTKLEGNPPNIKATVFFPSHGNKQLLLKFAKLQILE